MNQFPFTIYLAGFLSALTCSSLAFPFWRRWCERVGHVDDPGHRKIHHTPVPLAGGLTVATGFLLPLLLVYIFLLFRPEGESAAPELLAYGFNRRFLEMVVILIGAIGMVFLGWLDDRLELKPKWKFAGQLLIALMVAAVGVRITLFVPSQLFSLGITVLWILTLTNAFNFMDNMNGLCTGLGVISTFACAWVGAIQGQYLVSLLGFVICGALLGFLPFNFPKASAFLGDAGSHLVGYLTAILAILPNYYSAQTPNVLAVLSPLLIVIIPLIDLVWVVLLRWSRGKPIYIGDTNHLSHQLVGLGLTRTTAVLCLWLGNAISAAAALIFFR